MNISPTLALLEIQFPGLALIPIIDAGRALSYAPQTTRNLVAAGKFPVPTHLVGGKRVVKKTDLAKYIDSLGLSKTSGPGRPKGSTKAAKLRAIALEGVAA